LKYPWAIACFPSYLDKTENDVELRRRWTNGEQHFQTSKQILLQQQQTQQLLGQVAASLVSTSSLRCTQLSRKWQSSSWEI
jgi:hypothetical protein